MNALTNSESPQPESIQSEARTTPLFPKKIDLNLPERKSLGGGAGVKYYPPISAADHGIRVLNDQNSLHSTEPNGPVRVLETLVITDEARLLVRELLPQTFLTQELKESFPKIFGVGVCNSATYQADYYELAEGKIEQVIGQVWKDFARAGTRKNIFLLTEHIPYARETDSWDPSKYAHLEHVVIDQVDMYEKILPIGLNLYLEMLKSGIWNADLKDKEPFLFKGRQVKIIDAGGIAIIKGTGAEAKIIKLYKDFENEITRPLKDQKQGTNGIESRIEYLSIGIDQSINSFTQEIGYEDIALLLNRCCIDRYLQAQPETQMIGDLKACYEAISRGESYWETENPGELLEMFIIKLRTHRTQRIRLTS